MTSRRARKFLQKARVVAVEANPFIHQRHSKSTDFAALNIDYRLSELSDTDSPITFNVLEASEGTRHNVQAARSSLLLRDDPRADYESVTVPGVRLDSLARDGTRAALMMIEVESAPFWHGLWLVHDVLAHLMDKGLVPVAHDFKRRNQFNILLMSPQFMTLPDVLPMLEMQHSLARFRADTGA